MATFRELAAHRRLKVGTYISEFATPNIGRVLAASGCEFAFVDMEHNGFSFDTIRQLLRSLHDAGIATVTRPPSQEVHHLSRLCDVGAQGVIPPMLSNAAQARACLDAIKYAPEGKRGAAFGVAHDDFNALPPREAMQAGNNRTGFAALIETAEGVSNAGEIAAMDNVDCLWIGHLDLSISLGIPGAYDDPAFVEAVATITQAARNAGKGLGRLVASADEAEREFAAGTDFMCYLGDVWVLKKALTEGFDEIRQRIGTESQAGG